MFAGSACPDHRTLQDIMLGLAGPDTVEKLALHIENCKRCGERLRDIEIDDSLQAAIRSPGELADVVDTENVRDLIERVRSLRRGPGAKETALEAAGSSIRVHADDFLSATDRAGELGQFGPYRVVQRLGSGGMGVVYLARQERPARLVALKVLSGALPVGAERLARFRAEAEVLGRLQHPQILQIYEAGEKEGHSFYTMEYAEGGSLSQRLAVAPLSALEAAALVEAIARAVQAAHELGVIHRDLKPSNVLLMADGTPKVGDFGLAKQLERHEDGALFRTETGAILGTPGYMAPEQAGGGAGVGPPADVYALGAILYEALTGRPPFKGATLLETLEQARTREPVPPSRLQPGVPRDLQAVCLKCLEKQPRRRYGAAADLADDLGRFLRSEPTRARPVGAVARAWKWARRRPALAGFLGVTILSGIGLVVGALFHNDRLRREIERADAGQASAHASAAEARRQREVALGNYRAARDALGHMLDRLKEPRVAGVPRMQELRRDLLDDALAFYQGALAQLDDPDAGVRFDAAQAYMQTASIQYQLSRTELAKANLQRAMALLEALVIEHPDVPEYRAKLASCYHHRGYFCNSDVKTLAEGESWYTKAQAQWEEVIAAKPANKGWLSELARAHHGQADVNLSLNIYQGGDADQRRSRHRRAAEHYAKSVEIRTRLGQDDPDADDYLIVAEDLINLGMVYGSRDVAPQPGDPVHALIHGAARRLPHQAELLVKDNAVYEAAEAFLRRLAEKHAADTRYPLSLAALYMNETEGIIELGRAHARGRQAEQMVNEAIRLARKTLGQEPDLSRARTYLTNALTLKAQLHDHIGHYSEAAEALAQLADLEESPQKLINLAERARMLAHAGDRSRALAEAHALTQERDLPKEALLPLAQAYALASRPASLSERPAAEANASQALALLRKLQAAGSFNDAGTVEELRKNPDLESLRGRQDFQELLRKIAAEPNPPRKLRSGP